MHVPILMYHWFESPALGPGRSPEFGMRPADFRRQMEWIARSGCHAVKLGEIVAAAREHAPLPARPIHVTFDDAYQDFLEHALPALGDNGVPATLFVVAGMVGGHNVWDQATGEPPRPLLGWPELREIAAAGVEIGSHSMSHPDLRRIDDAQLAAECQRSRREIEDRLGRPVRYFAYPFGRHDARVKAAVVAAGYEAACAVLLRPWDLLRSDSFALRRVIIHANRSFASFRLRARFAAPSHQVSR